MRQLAKDVDAKKQEGETEHDEAMLRAEEGPVLEEVVAEGQLGQAEENGKDDTHDMTKSCEEAKTIDVEGLGQQDSGSTRDGEEGDDVEDADAVEHDVTSAGESLALPEEAHGEFGNKKPHKSVKILIGRRRLAGWS